MLRRLSLRDFVIVQSLEVEFAEGFSVLTGETGAGKSILVDALQLALGSRGDASVVREGAARTDITAEFDTPSSLQAWLEENGFDAADAHADGAAPALLLRRSIDGQGKSRAWINGSVATVTQLREAADRLVDIHGQHAWQSLTRSVSVRALLDAYAGIDTAPMAVLWSQWKAAGDALDQARTRQGELERERERLSWQISELERQGIDAGDFGEIDAEHQRISHAQALIDAVRQALDALSDGEPGADQLTNRAIDALAQVASFDKSLESTIDVLHSAQAQLEDAAHTLASYLHRTEPDPARLAELDERMSAWTSASRRYRRPPAELPALLDQWRRELAELDAASNLEALERRLHECEKALQSEARRVSKTRSQTAPQLADTVTQAMQQLGMRGGRFEVSLQKQEQPQSFGLESAEFMVAGHAGSTPRPLGKVASGGELSRIALAIAVTTSQLGEAGTLIFDEIDSGVGGAVAETVGRLMKQLGVDRQVLAVTHLPQVAACADHHFVVSKAEHKGVTVSDVRAVSGEARVAEIARMLGGERLSSTSLAHAEEMLGSAASRKRKPSVQAAESGKAKPGRRAPAKPKARP